MEQKQRPSFLSLEELATSYSNCQKCSLYQSRTSVVFGGGRQDSRLLLVLESPNYEDDQVGGVCNGPEDLDLLLSMYAYTSKHREFSNIAGLLRSGEKPAILSNPARIRELLLEEVFMTYAVLCRPTDPVFEGIKLGPSNPMQRKPTTSEIQACNSRLKNLVYVLDPLLIITLGSAAFQAFGGKGDIRDPKLHGSVQTIQLEGQTHGVVLKYPVVPLASPLHIARDGGADSVKVKGAMSAYSSFQKGWFQAFALYDHLHRIEYGTEIPDRPFYSEPEYGHYQRPLP